MVLFMLMLRSVEKKLSLALFTLNYLWEHCSIDIIFSQGRSQRFWGPSQLRLWGPQMINHRVTIFIYTNKFTINTIHITG